MSPKQSATQDEQTIICNKKGSWSEKIYGHRNTQVLRAVAYELFWKNNNNLPFSAVINVVHPKPSNIGAWLPVIWHHRRRKSQML